MTDRELAKALMEVVPLTMRFIRREVKAVSKADLQFPHYRVLAYVSRQPSTNRELADWQGVSFAAMSRMLDGMIRRGLLTRRPETEDRRCVRVTVTAKGKATYHRMRSLIQDKMAKKLTRFPLTEKAKLNAGLAVLQEVFT